MFKKIFAITTQGPAGPQPRYYDTVRGRHEFLRIDGFAGCARPVTPIDRLAELTGVSPSADSARGRSGRAQG
jgi:hypothetical protein